MKAQPTSTIIDPPSPPEAVAMDQDDEEEAQSHYDDEFLTIPKLVSFQADLIYNCMVTLSAPIFSLLSVASESYHRAEEAKDTMESAVHKVPYNITHGSILLLKKLGIGILGAAYVCMVLIMVLILAAMVGVGLVNLWVEEPVFLRERLHFDYTQPHPKAVFAVGGGVGVGEGVHEGIIGNHKRSRKNIGVPVGHTFYVSLLLLMPESDFNRDIGVFQMSAEVLSANGDVIAKSSQPCMLRFRSLPIRLTRTFLMGVPLLLGISAETQKMSINILKHKELGSPRTNAIRVSLSPRAGTSYVPQVYEAEIIMNSQLPWTKQLVHSWKWTFYVWASLYCYILFLILLITCCRPLFFLPITIITASTTTNSNVSTDDHIYSTGDQSESSGVSVVPRGRTREARMASTGAARDDESDEVSEFLRKWQRSRSKRKAIYLQAGDFNLPGTAEAVGSSAASTISISRDDTSTAAAEDVEDSESVCTECVINKLVT